MKNKFKLDENIPKSSLSIFSSKGVNAENVYNEGVSGCTDKKLIKICEKENRILVSQDLDFSDINLLRNTKIRGVVILRIKNQSSEKVNKTLIRFLNYLETRDINRQIIILDENKLRIKEL